MRIQLIPCLGLFAMGLAAHPLPAQADTAAPRAVADSFFHFLADERFVDAARLMDLEAFDAHRRSTIEFARHPMPQRKMTASDFMKFDPKMPRVVAEYQAKRFKESALDMSAMYRFEFGVSTLDSVASLSAEQLAARSLAARDVRAMMRESLRDRRGPCALTAAQRREVVARMRVRPARIIGVVTQDSIAYVLHDRGDLDVLDPLADSSAGHSDSAVPMPAKAADRGWVAAPPAFLFLRRVGTAWRVGPSMDPGGMAFISGCDRARRNGKK